MWQSSIILPGASDNPCSSSVQNTLQFVSDALWCTNKDYVTVDSDHITVLGMSLYIRLPNFVQVGPSSAQIWCYIDFQDDGRCGAILFSVSDLVTYHCLQKARVYQQSKFHSYNSSHGWDITISGLEKQTSAILEFYFRFRFRQYHCSRHVVLHQSSKFLANRTLDWVMHLASEFRPNRSILSGDMMFSRWRHVSTLVQLWPNSLQKSASREHGWNQI